MKYLAILKDSFREALDTKVFYVMVVLSLIVVAFLLTLTFEPVSADNFYRPLVQGSLGALDRMRDKGGVQHKQADAQVEGVGIDGKWHAPLPTVFQFELVQTKAIDGADNSPDATYVVTVRTNVRSAENVETVKKNPGAMLAQLTKELNRAVDLDMVHIRDIRLATNPVGDQGGATYVYCEFVGAPGSNTRRLWPHKMEIVGSIPLLPPQGQPLGLLLYGFAGIIMGIGSWVTLVVSIVLTAFFIPNMLRKGTVDLLLVKPIHRPTLLVYKYLGGLTFIFLNTTVAIGGIWLALGLKSGVWANNFLLMIPVFTFFFAILYAVSAVFGVLTQSPIVSILATCMAWFFFFVVGAFYNFVDQQKTYDEIHNTPVEQRWTDNTFCKVLGVIHFVTPRTGDLNRLSDIILARDFLTGPVVSAIDHDKTSITWGESITVSLVFIGVMLGLASWWFSTKDY